MTEQERFYCSFCGKSVEKVEKLIASISAMICNECVDLCVCALYDEGLTLPSVENMLRGLPPHLSENYSPRHNTYIEQAEKYRPKTITTLLVAEAPPPSGKKYFFIPRPMSDKIPIENDRSLPATIFHHYFQRRPTTVDEYRSLLIWLKDLGIFLIDIYDAPIKVRGNPEAKQIIISQIKFLRNRMQDREIHVPDENIIFLLPRSGYEKHLKKEFPKSQLIRWKDFRMNPVR